MYLAHRFASALLLTAAFATSGPIAAARTPAPQEVQVRVYDSGHKDYHNWDEREDRAYRRYLTEKHIEYRDYAKLKEKEQGEYWKWRHSHPD